MKNKKYKVILINPPYSLNLAEGENNIPLGLICIGTYIKKKGYNPIVLDFSLENDCETKLKNYLKDSNVLAVGLSVMAAQTPAALKLSKLVKEKRDDVSIVFGGAHPTCFPKETCENEFVDFVVKQEGEESFTQLLNYLSWRRLNKIDDYNKLDDIKGVCFKRNKKVFINEDMPYLDFEKLPQPDWALLKPDVIRKINYAPVHSGRGCSHRCTFCINRINSSFWRGKSVDKVISELIYSIKIFKTNKVLFWDENFFQNPKRAKLILEEIITRKIKIKWSCNIRANYFKKNFVDDDMLILMKKAGCETVATGVESGSQRILDKIKKDIVINDVIKECEMLTKHGIQPQFSFMIGLPGETKKDMMETVNLIDKLVKINPKVEIFGPQKFRPYPGGELYNEVLKSGWSSPKSLEEWSSLMEKNWNYLPAKSFPWVKNPNLVESLEVYTSFGARSYSIASKTTVKTNKFFIILFITCAKIRWKLRFFYFPFEFKIAYKVLELKNKLLNGKNK